MPHAVQIDYTFHLSDGGIRNVPLRLDANTLALLNDVPEPAPAWTALACHQCDVCPLSPHTHPHCPIALRLAGIVTLFQADDSFAPAIVEVDDGERRYRKETSLQQGLGALIGIVMVSAGCPVMDALRPLVRFHLPFASLEETEFRIVSMYLVAQYLRARNGLPPDWPLDGLQAIYDRVQRVNLCFADRIRSAAANDASVNAIILLDCFAKGVPFAVRTALRDYEHYFATHLRQPPPPGQEGAC